jgi:hypothetical protein
MYQNIATQRAGKSKFDFECIDQQKKETLGISFFVVDPDLETWNTFIDCLLEWEPNLIQIYEKDQIGVNRSD